jgi:cytochrome c-type biogenesis protein CcmH
MKWLLAALTALCVTLPPLAGQAAPQVDDPAIEQRFTRIAEELRCLVCQNESLAGSRADLAMDLKREVRQLIKDGRTDLEIKDFMVARYGDFVLYRPPVKPTTYLLWAGPFVLQVVGIALLIRFLRRRNRKDGETVPDEPQKERVDAP